MTNATVIHINAAFSNALLQDAKAGYTKVLKSLCKLQERDFYMPDACLYRTELRTNNSAYKCIRTKK